MDTKTQLNKKIFDLNIHLDDRGSLYEIFRTDSEYYNPTIGFGQVYAIYNPTRNIIRAFHYHKRKHDWFHIVRGSAKVILKGEDGIIEEYILSASKPQLLYIPPKTYHGWMSLEDNTILLNFVNEPFKKENPDDSRIPYDSFGKKIWEIKFK